MPVKKKLQKIRDLYMIRYIVIIEVKIEMEIQIIELDINQDVL